MNNEVQKFHEHVRQSIISNTFVKITFGKYRGDDKEFKNIFVKKISSNEGQKFSFTFRYTTKDIVKNYDTEKAISLVSEITGRDFLSATLFTTQNDFTVEFSKRRIPVLHKKKPLFTTVVINPHNKDKLRFVNQHAKYLYLTGITTVDGKVKASMYDKFRQIDKFIEIVDLLYRVSDLKDKSEIEITDMGSGKSYMTFALYDYFTSRLNKNASILGIEQREELVNQSNQISKECGFEGLKFKTGSIDSTGKINSDITVALHACDTATDDAIYKAVTYGAEIIVLAPCCQKYLRKKMKIPGLLKPVFSHGILEERLAVSLTDGLRALVLEYSGYDVKVFEFISSEHTDKNTMITAVKRNSKDNNRAKILDEIIRIKDEFLIADFYLDKLFLINAYKQ